MTISALQIDGLQIDLASRRVIEALQLQLQPAEIGCLLGASGSGKTTVLRAVAGLIRPTHGTIALQGQVVSTERYCAPPESRRLGMMFQDLALFPHLTVQANVAFGLHGLRTTEKQNRVTEMLEWVGLQGEKKRFPHELSGGQQQRVALARALAPRPQLLLLDEPFSSLDADLRTTLAREVRDILKQSQTTALLVTHDQHEAFAMADRMGVMHQGRVLQWAAPYQIYHQPAHRYIASFIGEGVWLPGIVERPGWVQTDLAEFELPAQPGYPTAQRLEVLLRPDDVTHDDQSPLQARVLHKAFRGAEFLYTLQLQSGLKVLASVPSHHDHPVGSMIGIITSNDHVVAFPQLL